MIIASIDVGYHNLGLVQSKIDDITFEIQIKEVFKIDLAQLPHRKVNRWECTIPHTNEVADLVAHFIQEYGNYLEEADKNFNGKATTNGSYANRNTPFISLPG